MEDKRFEIQSALWTLLNGDDVEFEPIGNEEIERLGELLGAPLEEILEIIEEDMSDSLVSATYTVLGNEGYL